MSKPDSQPEAAVSPVPQASAPVSPRTLAEEQSAKTASAFLSTSKLNVNLPKELYYTTYDPGYDNMVALYGENAKLKLGMTMVAHKGNASPEQAFAFFQGEESSLPNTSKEKITIASKPTQTIQGAPNSGISNITMWNGQSQSGSEVNVLYVQRTDQQGAYMIVFTGPEGYFTQDSKFNGILNSAKALKP